VKRLLLPSTAFVRSSRRFVRKTPELAAELRLTLDLLAEDATHPQLRTHKLKGKLASSWACSAGYDLRIVFQFVNHKGREAILLEAVGTHDEVYRRDLYIFGGTARAMSRPRLEFVHEINQRHRIYSLALLETIFLVHRLPPWSPNRGTRLVKAPKLHLVDTGLAAHLAGADAVRLSNDRALMGALSGNLRGW